MAFSDAAKAATSDLSFSVRALSTAAFAATRAMFVAFSTASNLASVYIFHETTIVPFPLPVPLSSAILSSIKSSQHYLGNDRAGSVVMSAKRHYALLFCFPFVSSLLRLIHSNPSKSFHQ